MVTLSLKLSHHPRLLFSFLTTAVLRPLPRHFLLPPKSFRRNTCKNVSKQRTLTLFRMNTYEKHRGGGVLLLTRFPMRESVLRSIAAKDLSSDPKKVRGLRPGGDQEVPVAGNIYPAHPERSALFVRSLRSLHQECLTTLLQSTASALFFKTPGWHTKPLSFAHTAGEGPLTIRHSGFASDWMYSEVGI
jgi:hypothetical protein